MKREFLKNLDLGDGAVLPDAAIEAIMTEYGKTVTPLQDSISTLTEERDGLQTQLTDAQNKLGDIQQLQTDNQNLKNQLTALQESTSARDARDKVSADTGVPAALLTAMTEEECKAQADAMLAWKDAQPKYPSTNDGGEPPAGGGSGNAITNAWMSVSEGLGGRK